MEDVSGSRSLIGKLNPEEVRTTGATPVETNSVAIGYHPPVIIHPVMSFERWIALGLIIVIAIIATALRAYFIKGV